MKSNLNKYRVLGICLATILIAGVISPIATAATNSTRFQAKGLTASLFGGGNSADGSVATTVQVTATLGEGQTPNALLVSVGQFDNNLFTETTCYFGASIPLTSSQFQFSPGKSAALNVTGAVLQDCITGATVTADISITWTAFGTSSRSRSISTDRSRTLISRFTSSGFGHLQPLQAASSSMAPILWQTLSSLQMENF